MAGAGGGGASRFASRQQFRCVHEHLLFEHDEFDARVDTDLLGEQTPGVGRRRQGGST